MEHNNDFQQLMERIDRSNRRQARYGLLQCIFSLISVVCCVALLLLVISAVPQFQSMAQQAETVLSNLETVSNELAAVDLAGMVDDVDTLVSDSQTALTEALIKLNSIDLDSLNKAINNLSDVIEPLAKLGNLFGR